jgi:hypothetical protein
MPRDNRHPASEQTNRSSVIALAAAFVVGGLVFGGFYLGAHWTRSESSGSITTPHPESENPLDIDK